MLIKGYQSRVSIDTQPQMPLVHMIPNINGAYLFFLSLVLTLLYSICLVKEDIGIYGNIIISKLRNKIMYIVIQICSLFLLTK